MKTDFFSSRFDEARDRFRRAAESVGATCEELPVEVRGPEGEPLAIIIARLGSDAPKQVLLHSSGVHGVEGFVGSALQLQLLSQPPQLDSDSAIVVIHGVNPYGMAWLRRMNENNVDLNRNFRADLRLNGTPHLYCRLNRLLNFEGPPRRLDAFYPRAIWCILRHGLQESKQAVGEGQYSYPKSLFYGGRQQEQESCLVLDWVGQNLASARRIVSIDVHSGLGPYGVDSLLVHYSSASEQGQILSRWFGERVKFDHGTGVAYRVNGGYLEGLERTLPDTQWYSITQEYGTYRLLKMLKILRDENLYHHYSAQVDVHHSSKRKLLRAFCPDDSDWQQSVLWRGRSLLGKATRLALDPTRPPTS